MPSFSASTVAYAAARERPWRFIGAGTTMRDLVAAFPWQDTPLGPIADWPASLRTAAGVVMHSVHPMFLWWGEQLTQLYNDAYVPCFGEGKHPAALGQAGRDCWPEIWAIIGPQIEAVRAGGEPRWYADNLVPIWRNGGIEDVYWSYTYTPVFDEADRVGGVLVVCLETTTQVLAERRRHTLDLLARRLLGCRSEQDVRDGVAQAARDNPADLPALSLLRGEAAHAAADPADADLVLVRGAELQLCADLALAFRVSPRLPLDGAYRQFLEQFTAAVCATLSRIESDRALAEAMAESERLNLDLNLSSRIKDEFLAMLGHELRNPLAPIVTALQLMQLRGGDYAQKERAVIERQTRHLVTLVDDLLDVSRVAEGKIQLHREPVEIAEVVARAIETASPLIEAKRHALDVAVPATGLAVLADPARCAQVLSNLLANAAKYTEAGGRLQVAARRDGDDVVVAVRDNGIGIDAAMLPAIFDLFVQERQALSRSQGGLGLGLSIARSMMELHGGSVEAHSDGVGRGSEFTIRLAALAPDQAPPAPPPSACGPADAPRSGQTILVVDDNEDAARALGELLSLHGHTVEVVFDAPSALALAPLFRPDVGLLDIGLPGMDGYELAQRLRRHHASDADTNAPLRLFALTGYGQESDRRRAAEAGFDAHLTKPIDVEALLELLCGNKISR